MSSDALSPTAAFQALAIGPPRSGDVGVKPEQVSVGGAARGTQPRNSGGVLNEARGKSFPTDRANASDVRMPTSHPAPPFHLGRVGWGLNGKRGGLH